MWDVNRSDTSECLMEVLPECTEGVDGSPNDVAAPLWPGEEEMIEGVVPSRRQEVKAGRQCARRALAALGAPMGPLPPDSDGVPQWPRGIRGSITHTEGYVAAAVCPRTRIESLGIDAEHVSRVEREFVQSIATPAEMKWLSDLPTPTNVRGRALLFSGKEAAYKCQFPLTREKMGFQAASLKLDADVPGTGGTFSVSFHRGPEASVLPAIRGNYCFTDELIVTSAFLPHSGQDS